MIKDLPIAQRIYLHGELLTHGILPCCMTCQFAKGVYTKERDEELACDKANGALPPLDVIIRGCEMWVQDIPF